MDTKHEPFYYWQRMLAEFSSCNKGCNVSYGLKHLTLRYHDTDVASWYLESGEIVLRHGGWLTLYTRERINRFLSVLDIGAQLYQAKKVWYVAETDCDQNRAWCRVEGHEDDPGTFTLATKLEGARDDARGAQ